MGLPESRQRCDPLSLRTVYTPEEEEEEEERAHAVRHVQRPSRCGEFPSAVVVNLFLYMNHSCLVPAPRRGVNDCA